MTASIWSFQFTPSTGTLRLPQERLAELKRRTSKPIIVCILASREEIIEDEKILQEAGIPVFQAPEDAALAACYLAKYHQYMLKGRDNRRD